jgi:hypothetical protein
MNIGFRGADAGIPNLKQLPKIETISEKGIL